jgi:transcriptional regulator GlxA family with amidase domain
MRRRTRPRFAAGAEREICGGWSPVRRSERTAPGLADSQLMQLARAIQWIRGHYDKTLRVEEPARLATMSGISFHRHFRAVTAMTLIQFQK